ncbi:OsmC family protein [Actinomadura barringtoniae]|uniref:OsmC family protein n=1 Tax=Actinomadura barringtoniae TaxID=1427535 RepID=A0A939T4B0_9ACTN|nr:OsmC family protein [Actinomadura barringtoniae]MBO2447954.1 OsmC family protein [Actinomadura barringtoniae]
MNAITVIHRQNDEFAILIRDHVVHVDQPYSAGGENHGPTPVELFVASLAGCAAHYGRQYLAAHGQPSEGLRVSADFATSCARPARVTRVRLVLHTPLRLSDDLLTGLLAAVDGCTVKNSLARPPVIETEVTTDVVAA